MNVAPGRCCSSQPRSGPSPDHDQAGAGDPRDLHQAAYLLLRGQAADVPDEDRRGGPRRSRPGPAQRLAAAGGIEEVERDAPAPQVQVGDAQGRELGVRRPRRDEGPGRASVEPADPLRGQDVGPDAVVPGEPGDVGLVDRDGRDAQPAGRAQGDRSEHDRRRQVHDVGPELHERPLHRGIGQPHRERPVARQRERPHADHGHPAVVRLARSRRDDQDLVTQQPELLDDVAHGVRDAVDLGQEGLGDQGYAHAPTVVVRVERAVTVACAAGDGAELTR